MYCKKCRYTSFDHLSSCPKCGQDWMEEKKKLGIEWLWNGEKGWFEHNPENSAGQASGPERKLSQEDGFSLHADHKQTDPAEELYADILEGLSDAHDRASPGTEPGFNPEAEPHGKEPQVSTRDTSLEPDLEFDYQDKDLTRQKPQTSGQDYEIEYPKLEFTDPEKKEEKK